MAVLSCFSIIKESTSKGLKDKLPFNKSLNIISFSGFLILTVNGALQFKTVSSDSVSQNPS